MSALTSLSLYVLEFVCMFWISWICRFMPIIKFGDRLVSFSGNSFSFHIIVCMCVWILITSVLDTLLLFHRFLKLFFSAYFLLLRMGNFYCSIFKFIDSFLWYHHSTIEHTQWVYFTFFQFYNFDLFPLFIFYLLIFSIFFISFKCTCNCSIKHFYNDCFSDNSNIFIMPLLASVLFSHSSWAFSGSQYHE